MDTITFRKHPRAPLGVTTVMSMGRLAGAASAQNAGNLLRAEGLGLPPLPGSMGSGDAGDGSPNRPQMRQGESGNSTLDQLMAWERQGVGMGVRPNTPQLQRYPKVPS